MAIQFPSPAYQGESYLAENGVEYIFDGIKWVGFGSTVNPVSDHLHAGNVDLYLFSNGVVQLPEQGDIVDANGTSVIGGMSASTGNFVFDGDIVNMPGSARLNSGGMGNTGAAEIGTDVLFYSYQQPSTVVQHSEIFMGSGAGEFRSIYDNSDSIQNSLTYAGVEDTGSGYFSGIVSQTPGVNSMYSVAIDGNNNIIIGAAQQEGSLTSDDWGTGLGTLNAGYTVNGIYANTTQTQINGGTATTKINLSDDGLVVSTADTQSWTFGPDGNLTFPNGNLTIGHDPYGDPAIIGAAGKNIGLVSSGVGDGYEVGSSLIWVDSITEPTKMAGVTANNPLYVGAGDVGIVTGDYFYTGNTNVWNFGADGNITLPANGYILNSDLTVYGGGGTGVGNSWLTGSGLAPAPGTNPGDQYLDADTGNVYQWDGESWILRGNIKGPAGTGGSVSISDFGDGFGLNNANKIVTNKLYSTNQTNSAQHYRLELDTNGVVVLPDQSIINGSVLRGVYGTGEANYTGITIGPDADHREESWVWVDHTGVSIATEYSTSAHTWKFDNDGNLTLPANGYILNSDLTVYGGGGGGGNYSNSNVSDYMPVYSGNIGGNIVHNGYSWTFGDDGNLFLPDGGMLTNIFGETTLTNPAGAAISASIGNAIAVSEQYGAAVYVNNNAWQFQANANVILPPGGYILNSSGSIYGQSAAAGIGTQNIELSTDLSFLLDSLTGNIMYITKNQYYSGTDEHAILLSATPADGTRIVFYNETDLMANVHYGDLYYLMDPTGRLEMAYSYYQGSPSWLPIAYTIFSP